jgi:diadenosine tetraphosphate (Ap4A) HIT family hydrolase
VRFSAGSSRDRAEIPTHSHQRANCRQSTLSRNIQRVTSEKPERLKQEVVFESDLVRFLQDRRHRGALKHSGVIIPIKHRETVFDLSDAEIAATFQLLSRVKTWMDREFLPDGYNIGWNCGRVGGQELFHAHMHVIPRFRQEPLAGKGIRSLLKSDANRW